EYDLTGVVGGLTAVQRRALRVELLLGNRPDLGQARLLASFRWAAVVGPVRDWPADLVAKELRKYGVLATPVTVRVALWWTGAKATVLRPRQPGDRRSQWERVRDECEDLVARLRDRGSGIGMWPPIWGSPRTGCRVRCTCGGPARPPRRE
ncbi:hypothetical protein D3C59_37130, partial [Streptomyces sp. SHP22-7]